MNIVSSFVKRCESGCNAVDRTLRCQFSTGTESSKASTKNGNESLLTELREIQLAGNAEARLKFYQKIKISGFFGDKPRLYLIASQVQLMTDALLQIQLASAEEDGDSGWTAGDFANMHPEFPSECLSAADFQNRYAQEWDDIFVSTLRKHGEKRLAELFVKKRDEFLGEFNRGFYYFHQDVLEVDVQEKLILSRWFAALISGVYSTLEVVDPDLRLGYSVEEGCDPNTQVSLFPIRPPKSSCDVETTRIVPLNFNVFRLQALFDHVEQFDWRTEVDPDVGTPLQELCIEGTFRGRRVVLNLSQSQPDWEPMGTFGGRINYGLPSM